MSMHSAMMPQKSYHRPVRLGGQKDYHGGAWERRPQPAAKTTAKLRMLAYFAKQYRTAMKEA